MTKLVNRAKMTTATTGTGTITLGSAVDGYQAFANAGVTDGDVVRYVIEDGSDWEIGTGTYTATGTTLSRTVSESSNADAAINLSGSAVVYVTATDADFREEGVGSITGSTLDLPTGNVFSYTPAADTTFVFSNPPATGTAYGMTLKVTGADVTVWYDLANASYDSVSFSVAGQEATFWDIDFKPDGTKMYIVGSTGDAVYQYSLSTAWDLSTASYDSVSFSVSAQDTFPLAVTFKPDGTKMYISGTTNDRIYQYSLSTAWDLSTASYDSVSFSVSAQEANPAGLTFKPDGTKMYVGGSSSSVYQYSLSTAWDLSTASYDSVSFSVVSQDTGPRGIVFKPDGTKLYISATTSDSIYQYSLSTAWDLSTASYDSVSFSVVSQDTFPSGIVFKSDGTKMYVVGNTSDTIYQYSTVTSAPATLTYPTSVDWPSGTAPDAPADGETDVLVFYTQDGGTTYYGFQAGDAMA